MIKKIVLGDYLKRLDNIIQWQEKDVFNKESVSQHSYKVSVFTRVLLEELFGAVDSEGIKKFKLDCVTYALFHDWDEAIFLRDLSHSIKYNEHNGGDIRKAINDYVEFEFKKEFLLDSENEFCKKMLTESIVRIDPKVKMVVKLADWLALFFFCRREIRLGNKAFNDVYLYCKENTLKALDCVVKMIEDNFLNVINVFFVDEIIKTVLDDENKGV